MGQDGSELREFSRVPFHMRVKLTIQETELKATQIRDISMKGIFLEGISAYEVGTPCKIQLELEGVDPAIEMTLEGEVARADKSGSGIHFTRIPLESYEHLQHIVQLNSTNPHKSEDEIRHHVGLNPR